jgi:alpha-tubulin suppressor-like RCC1 family protein
LLLCLVLLSLLLDVCCGSVHTCILTIEGKVYTCGKFAYCGHGTREDCLIPRWLEKFHGIPVERISLFLTCGFHTIALTKDRKVYSWGRNRVGQLGLPQSPDTERYDDGGLYLATPCHISYLPDNVIDVSY